MPVRRDVAAFGSGFPKTKFADCSGDIVGCPNGGLETDRRDFRRCDCGAYGGCMVLSVGFCVVSSDFRGAFVDARWYWCVGT